MKRIHLFEFMDLKWYPRFLRQIQTNILQKLMLRTNAFDYSIPYIESELNNDKHETIVDLCSGSSGPWLRLISKMTNNNIDLLLTDKYPNIKMFEIIKEESEGKIGYIKTSIDALSTPNDLPGLKTIFTGFHHFKPDEAYKIMQNAKKRNDRICIFDYVPNKILTLILFPLTFIISFVQFYILSFLVRPITLQQIVFTNIIPIIPIVSAWDGFVSGMRKYSKRELEEILMGLDDSDYEVRIGEDRSLTKVTPMVYLIGKPSEN